MPGYFQISSSSTLTLGNLYEINLTTQAETLIATGGSRGDFVTVDPMTDTLLVTQNDSILRLTGATFAVPEPTSLVMLGNGVLGIVASSRAVGSDSRVFGEDFGNQMPGFSEAVPSRVALGVTPQGSHSSVLAQLTHTAPHLMQTLPWRRLVVTLTQSPAAMDRPCFPPKLHEMLPPSLTRVP